MAFAAKLVHGILIVAAVVMVYGFLGFAMCLGLGRPLVRLGLVAYVFGSAALILAAIVNGLVFPEVAARYAERSLAEMETAGAVLAWGWEFNQALDISGVLAWSVAVCVWSLALLRLPGAWRWIGGVGVVFAVAGALAFLTGLLSFDVHGFGMYLVAQSLWCLAVAVGLAIATRP